MRVRANAGWGGHNAGEVFDADGNDPEVKALVKAGVILSKAGRDDEITDEGEGGVASGPAGTEQPGSTGRAG